MLWPWHSWGNYWCFGKHSELSSDAFMSHHALLCFGCRSIEKKISCQHLNTKFLGWRIFWRKHWNELLQYLLCFIYRISQLWMTLKINVANIVIDVMLGLIYWHSHIIGNKKWLYWSYKKRRRLYWRRTQEKIGYKSLSMEKPYKAMV